MDVWDDIAARLAAEDVHAALRRTAPLLARLDADPAQRRRVLAVFAEIAARKFHRPIPALAAAAASGLRPDAHLALGHALIDARRPDLALGVLGWAAEQHPLHRGLLLERVAALELLGEYAQARRLLEDTPQPHDALMAHLLAHSAAMCGDIGPAKAAVAAGTSVGQGRLERVVARATWLQPDTPAGWLAANTGCAPLQTTGAHTWADVGRGVAGLAALLAAWSLRPEAVIPLSGSDTDRGLAALAADRLGLPLASGGPGLVVSYGLHYAPHLAPGLRQRVRGQIFYAHAASRQEHAVCPDILACRPAVLPCPWAPPVELFTAGSPPAPAAWPAVVPQAEPPPLPGWLASWAHAPALARPAAGSTFSRGRLWSPRAAPRM